MKLYVFDVDGTLVKNYGKMSKATIQAINELIDRGDAIAIASGRPLSGIKKYLKKFHKGYKFAICANGAALCDFEGNTYFESPLPTNLLEEIRNKYLDKVGKHGEIYCYIKHVLGYYDLDFFSLNELHWNKMPKRNLKKKPLTNEDVIYKIMLAGKEEDLDKIDFDKDIVDNYHVVKSAPYFTEIVSKKVDKYFAVSALANLLNISNEDVFCFGDEDNDLLMIQNYQGVAMGNAIEKVKEAAKYITKSVSEDGVAYALKELIK